MPLFGSSNNNDAVVDNTYGTTGANTVGTGTGHHHHHHGHHTGAGAGVGTGAGMAPGNGMGAGNNYNTGAGTTGMTYNNNLPPTGAMNNNPNNNTSSGGSHAMAGKIEHAIGTIVGSNSLKAKGAQKEQEAAAMKMQGAELAEAERHEQEARMRRERAVAHGAHPDNQHLGGINPLSNNAGMGNTGGAIGHAGGGMGTGNTGGAMRNTGY